MFSVQTTVSDFIYLFILFVCVCERERERERERDMHDTCMVKSAEMYTKSANLPSIVPSTSVNFAATFFQVLFVHCRSLYVGKN